MPPKPGFWYYDSIRAFKVYLFFALFGVGVYLSKLNFPSQDEVVDLILKYGVLGLFIFSVVLLPILHLRRIWRGNDRIDFYPVRNLDYPMRTFNYPVRNFNEPEPSAYGTREEFIQALREYGAQRGFKPGWVYYRSIELWPL